VQSAVDLPRGLAVDWTWRAVSRLRAGPVPAYHTSEVRVGWAASRQIELAVIGQNLHHRHRAQWASDGMVAIERSAHLRVTWRR
jgi:iron complex outermembrane receptor protein